MVTSPRDEAPDPLAERGLAGVQERHELIPFSNEEYEERLARVRRSMQRAGLDLLFLTAPESMCYLHGYEARWYRAHSTRSWPPCAGTAVHVDRDRLIHFDFVDEASLLPATSVVEDIRFYPDESEATCLRFLKGQLEDAGWLKGSVQELYMVM